MTWDRDAPLPLSIVASLAFSFFSFWGSSFAPRIQPGVTYRSRKRGMVFVYIVIIDRSISYQKLESSTCKVKSNAPTKTGLLLGQLAADS